MKDVLIEPVGVYEFWLNYQMRGARICRVALGDLVDSRIRRTYPVLNREDWENGNLTGKIGFMDLELVNEKIPNGEDLDRGSSIRALVVTRIGIEGDYRGRGFSKLLLSRAEEMVCDEESPVLFVENIQSSRLINHLSKKGYSFFERQGINAFRFI